MIAEAKQGALSGQPCVLCRSPLATHFWGLCGNCRYDRQQAADAAVYRLRRLHSDWYPQRREEKGERR